MVPVTILPFRGGEPPKVVEGRTAARPSTPPLGVAVPLPWQGRMP